MDSSEELSLEDLGKSPVREKSISNHRVHHNIQQYLVHWAGSNRSTGRPYEPTWKPEANIQNKDILNDYKVSIGIMAAPTKQRAAKVVKSGKSKPVQKQRVKIKSESPEKRTIKELVPLDESPPTSEEDVPSIRMSNSPRSVADSRRSSRGRSSTGRLSIEPWSKPPSVKASPANTKKRKIHVLSDDSEDTRPSPRARKIKRIPESSQSASQRSVLPEEVASKDQPAEKPDRTDAFARPPPALVPVASTSKVKSPTKIKSHSKARKSTGGKITSPENKAKRKKTRDWLLLGETKEQSFPTAQDFNEAAEHVIPDSQQEASLVSRYMSSGETKAPNLKPVPQPTARLLQSLQDPMPYSSPIENASSQIESELLPSAMEYETAPQSPLAAVTSPPKEVAEDDVFMDTGRDSHAQILSEQEQPDLSHPLEEALQAEDAPQTIPNNILAPASEGLDVAALPDAILPDEAELDDDSLPPPLDFDTSYKRQSPPSKSQEQEPEPKRLALQDKTQAQRWVEDDQSESARSGVLELLEGAVRDEVRAFFVDAVAYRDKLIPRDWETLCFHLADVDDEELVLVMSIKEARYRITLVPFGEDASFAPEMQHVRDWAEQQDDHVFEEPDGEVVADYEEQMRIQAEEQLQVEEDSRHRMAEAELVRLEQEEKQQIAEAEHYASQIRDRSASEDQQKQPADQLDLSPGPEPQEEDQLSVRSASQEVEEPEEEVNGVSSPEEIEDEVEEPRGSASPANAFEEQLVNGVSSPAEFIHSPQAAPSPPKVMAASPSPARADESDISPIAESFRFSQPEHQPSQIPTTVPEWLQPIEYTIATTSEETRDEPSIQAVEAAEFEEPAPVDPLQPDSETIADEVPAIEDGFELISYPSPPEWTGFDDVAQEHDEQEQHDQRQPEATLLEHSRGPEQAIDEAYAIVAAQQEVEQPNVDNTSMFELLREPNPSQPSSLDRPSINGYTDSVSFSQNTEHQGIIQSDERPDTQSIYPDLATFGDMLADQIDRAESRSMAAFAASAELPQSFPAATAEEAMLRPDDAATTLTGPLTTLEDGYSELLQARLDQLHREQQAAADAEEPAPNNNSSYAQQNSQLPNLSAMQAVIDENASLHDQISKLSRDNDALRSSRRYAEDEATKFRQAYAEASTAASLRGVEVIELEARVSQLERQLDEGLRQRDLVSKAREKRAADELNKLRIQHDLLKTNFQASDISMLRRQAALGIESAGVATDLRNKLARQEASAANWQQSLASGGPIAAQSDSDDESFSGSGESSSSDEDEGQEMSYQATPAQTAPQATAAVTEAFLCRWRQADETWCGDKIEEKGALVYHVMAHSDLL